MEKMKTLTVIGNLVQVIFSIFFASVLDRAIVSELSVAVY